MLLKEQKNKISIMSSSCSRVLNDENQSKKDPLQMPIGQITRAMAKKLQDTCNGLVKEFILVNRAFKEELKSNQVFEGI